MKNTWILLLFMSVAVHAQNITLPPNGDNQKSSVTQWIGPVSITITYFSPDVHGPDGEDRTGKIWGGTVFTGFVNQGFGSGKPAPWRAGANERTTISFSHDVMINKTKVPAGIYGLMLAVEKDKPWTWVISKDWQSWGSYFYDEKDDVLRVSSPSSEAPYAEYLSYGFDDRKPASATAYLHWEYKKVGLLIEVPNINEIYLNSIRSEFEIVTNRNTTNLYAAANFCLVNKINLEEALSWSELSNQASERFYSLRQISQLQEALGKNDDAKATFQKALEHPTATAQVLNNYGRSLLREGKTTEAMDIFLFNQKKHAKDKFTPFIGLGYGYEATGDKKNAAKSWEMVIKNIPEDQKSNLERFQGELAKNKS